MSTHAIETSDTRSAGGVLRWLDLAVLALALPIFLAAGILVGWALVAVVWIGLRALPAYLKRRAKTVDPRRGTLLLAVGMMARVWVLAITIFAAGMVEREAGLGAALLSIVLVTVNLVGVMMRGPFADVEAKP
jgi:hypothetical protein